LCFSFWSVSVFGQNNVSEVFGPKEQGYLLDSLGKIYGNKKIIPKAYELPILISLSHFPELRDLPIEFVVKNSYTPLSATPNIGTLFLGGNRRKFRIVISEKSTQSMNPILLKNLSFNAQLGVLGHELSHIIDYLNKPWMELIAVALNYWINPKYHEWMEKKADLHTINQGLGWELYSYYRFARDLAEATPEANWSNNFYLHYNEVLFEMQKRSLYNEYFLPNPLFQFQYRLR
jgi:hypothetical protein